MPPIPCPEVSYLLCFMCFTLLNEYCVTAFIFCGCCLTIGDLSDGSVSVEHLMESFVVKLPAWRWLYILAIKESPVKVDHKLSLWVAALCAIKKLRTWELVLTQSRVCPVYLDASFILLLSSYRTYVPPAFLQGSIVLFSSSLLYIGTKLLGCLPWLFALSRTKHHLCSVIHLFYYSRHIS